MQPQELDAANSNAPERVHVVSFPEYRELIVSRRKLERVCGRPDCLHDTVSDELFVLRPSIDLLKSAQAFAVSQ